MALSVASVPSLAATRRFFARLPPRNTAATSGIKRESSMITPPITFVNTVLAAYPPNALPLLFPIEVNAYSTSENPCAPLLVSQL